MRTSTRGLVLAALFAALTAVGAFLKFPLGASFVTLQFLFTALAGVLLGPRWGAISQAVYVGLGLVGLPVFTQGGGLGYLLIPSCGFLFGLIPAAWVIGWISNRGNADRGNFGRVCGACLAGLATLYVVGLPYMYLILNVYLDKGMSFQAVATMGMLVYLPGDALKILVTALVAPQLTRALPPLLR